MNTNHRRVKVRYINMRVFLAAGFILTFLPVTSHLLAQEPVYPPGFDITSEYVLSAEKLNIADTLTITRTIFNGGSFGLTRLYFSDNLPSGLIVAGESVQSEGIDLQFLRIGPISDNEVDGYDTYFWVLDSPEEGVTNIVASGANVTLELKIVCIDSGIFQLPLHTAVFRSNGLGLFSTSDALQVEFVLSDNDEEDPEIPGLLPGSMIISIAYPNPFNSSVIIKYVGNGVKDKPAELEICDLLGRRIYHDDFIPADDHGYITWRPEGIISTGLYLYRISSGERSTRGKIVFLK
ncbi:MAG: T9SS type A sorting domain-containing protein [Candidatus Zixiibacteriota bacterium]|nr:MAG: T9SS type A sorting domain-containing protein [candidate division Zixibacteria bacterium]